MTIVVSDALIGDNYVSLSMTDHGGTLRIKNPELKTDGSNSEAMVKTLARYSSEQLAQLIVDLAANSEA